MNQFVVMDDGRRELPTAKRYEQRGTLGATAIFVFSPKFSEIVTLYGSRFKNRKVPSGGIEEDDATPLDASPADAASRGALRELREETGITSDQLLLVNKSSVEDVIRGEMKRYYFVAIAKERIAITPFRSQEEGKHHYVDKQGWDSVENILRGASRAGESYNTLYCIALVRILQEMQREGFCEIKEFNELLIDLAHSGITLTAQLELLEARKSKEEFERSQMRRQY
jgi:ADP-ribose pyrophosphatase YjhB (NUDIX family)